MCLIPPKAPDIPEARPLAPMAEKTADAPVLGEKRTTQKPRPRNPRSVRGGLGSLRIPMRGRGI